jgi:ribbon-helix-helix CopG family protein
MRTIIDLTGEQLARLEEVAQREGISRAEAIRRAVDTAYAHVAASTAGAARAEAFGLWKGRKVDALRYVDDLRDDWEERLAGLHGSKYAPPAGSYAGRGPGKRPARVSEKLSRKRRRK